MCVWIEIDRTISAAAAAAIDYAGAERSVCDRYRENDK
jgi:hypothetical protein